MSTPSSPTDVAQALAVGLDKLQVEYAIGGALALGFWGEPRGTLDVDITLFVSPEKPATCINLLIELECDLNPDKALDSLREHGFCRIEYMGTRVDVFLPVADFYKAARSRRKSVRLGQQDLWIWDAESLVVFKLMFFRRKDLADIEQILRHQSDQLDRKWIRSELVNIYGHRDPRISTWDELAAEQ